MAAATTASLRKDHNILLRVIEARKLPNDCQDTYCIVRIDNHYDSQVQACSPVDA